MLVGTSLVQDQGSAKRVCLAEQGGFELHNLTTQETEAHRYGKPGWSRLRNVAGTVMHYSHALNIMMSLIRMSLRLLQFDVLLLVPSETPRECSGSACFVSFGQSDTRPNHKVAFTRM